MVAAADVRELVGEERVELVGLRGAASISAGRSSRGPPRCGQSIGGMRAGTRRTGGTRRRPRRGARRGHPGHERVGRRPGAGQQPAEAGEPPGREPKDDDGLRRGAPATRPSARRSSAPRAGSQRRGDGRGRDAEPVAPAGAMQAGRPRRGGRGQGHRLVEHPLGRGERDGHDGRRRGAGASERRGHVRDDRQGSDRRRDEPQEGEEPEAVDDGLAPDGAATAAQARTAIRRAAPAFVSRRRRRASIAQSFRESRSTRRRSSRSSSRESRPALTRWVRSGVSEPSQSCSAVSRRRRATRSSRRTRAL